MSSQVTDNVESSPSPLQLDVRGILRSRAPRIPGFVASAMARLLREKELNALLREAFPNAGHAFSLAILRALGIEVKVSGRQNIPERGKLLFASNHPLGGLDGIALIGLLGGLYGDERIIFPVNDMLMNVRPLKDVFTPVNKYGGQGRGRTSSLMEAFGSDRHVIMFPAGLVSRLGENGVHDKAWRKTFFTKAIDTGRIIVPVRFEAANRRRFYNIARWRERLRIPVNLEQALLPSELVHCRRRTFHIRFLPPVDPVELLRQEGTPPKAVEYIYNKVELQK